MRALKIALLCALVFTALWLLSPSHSSVAKEPGVVEISFMAPGGGGVSDLGVVSGAGPASPESPAAALALFAIISIMAFIPVLGLSKICAAF